MANTDRVTRYYKVNNKKETTWLKAEIYYSLGGHNYFTSRNEGRGYYISVSPVEREGYFESYTAFTGLKQLILPVQRKSAKKMNEAVTYFEEHINDFIKNHFSEFEVDLESYEVR
jgi:hypothetical protein